MSSNTRESPTAFMRPDASRQSPARRPSTRKTSKVNPASGPEPKRRAKVDHECLDPQVVQSMLKFRTGILALDPCAKFFVDRDPLKVVHSRCNRKITQKAPNDISNFKEHVSICQVVTPSRPSQVPCPGFSFEELCGKAYRSLLYNERQQVPSAIDAAGLAWLEPREKKSVASKSCLKKSAFTQGPTRPCDNCSKVVESSNIRETLSRITFSPKHKFFNPFRSVSSTTVDPGEGHRAAGGEM